jgi:hypothetical protein
MAAPRSHENAVAPLTGSCIPGAASLLGEDEGAPFTLLANVLALQTHGSAHVLVREAKSVSLGLRERFSRRYLERVENHQVASRRGQA